MKCTQDVLSAVAEAIEATPYGSITITLNEKGKYVEISTEQKQRIYKDSDDADCGFHKG